MAADSSTSVSTPSRQPARSWTCRIGLVAGPILAGLTLAILPSQFSDGESLKEFSWEGRATLAMMVWMAVWWLTEAVNVTVTSLLPLVAFPLFQIDSVKVTAVSYADRLIFLYMGGFFLALAMQRWGLGKRIALLTIRCVGLTPYRIVGGFMLTTAVFSAFVSNTATAVMMVAIASNLTDLDGESESSTNQSFATCLMLAIAYSASIGGMATIIGTPPNTFLVGFLRDTIAPAYQMQMDFRQWLWFGVPLAVILLPLTYGWLMIQFRLPRPALAQRKSLLETQLRALGRMKGPEWTILAVFLVTVGLWMFSRNLRQWEWTADTRPLAYMTDEAIVMAMSFLLFVIPARSALPAPGLAESADRRDPGDPRNDHFILEWRVAEKLPWGILLLFGGGLALAAAVQRHSVAEFLASQTAMLNGAPAWLLVLGITAAVVFLTELTSNAATTASLVPILAAIAPSIGLHPYLLIFPATFAASCAFMLPVATPPNAIVFGTGRITGGQMARAGLGLNLAAIGIICVFTWIWLKPLLNL